MIEEKVENHGTLIMANQHVKICGIHGHVAEICYYIFDNDFVPTQRSSGPPRSSSQGSGRSSQTYPTAAFTATKSEPSLEEWWFPDSS